MVVQFDAFMIFHLPWQEYVQRNFGPGMKTYLEYILSTMWNKTNKLLLSLVGFLLTHGPVSMKNKCVLFKMPEILKLFLIEIYSFDSELIHYRKLMNICMCVCVYVCVYVLYSQNKECFLSQK